MKVLFVAPEDPYERDGGANLRLRPFVEAVAVVGESHLLTAGQKPGKREPSGTFTSSETVRISPMRTPARLLQSLLNLEPDIAFRSRTTRLATALHRKLLRERFDVVHLAGLQLAYLVRPFLDTVGGVGSRPVLVLDELNAEYVVHERLARAASGSVTPLLRGYSLTQMALLKRYERCLLPECDLVICPGEADRESLRGLAPGAMLRVVASGVDLEALAKVPAPPGEPVVLFVGDLNYRPNRQAVEWLLERVAPAVRAREVGVRFVIVGAGPRPGLTDGSGVEFAGYVDDLLPHLAAARVVVAPMLSGGGIKLKVLEGMAAGRAMVTTPVGAEGITGLNEDAIMIAEDAGAFAEAVVKLLRDDELAVGMGERAREFVRENFSAEKVGARYLEVIRTARSEPEDA
jgi:glycosyltransferase involved in cell wall biosynthesis